MEDGICGGGKEIDTESMELYHKVNTPKEYMK